MTLASDRVWKRGLAGLSAFALVATGTVLVAQETNGEAVVDSTDPAALPPPSEWRCDLIRPDYARYLEAGNAPDAWRYVGPTYRDTADGALYSWDDWLAWEQQANCTAALADVPGGLTTGHAAVGAAVAGLGTALLVSGNGANAKSPG